VIRGTKVAVGLWTVGVTGTDVGVDAFATGRLVAEKVAEGSTRSVAGAGRPEHPVTASNASRRIARVSFLNATESLRTGRRSAMGCLLTAPN
jgi:hypothetical protein